MQNHWRFLVALLAVLAGVPGADADDKEAPRIRIGGAVEKAVDWTASDLLKEMAGDVKEARYTSKRQETKAKVIPLYKLLTAAKPKIDPKQKNHLLTFIVTVRARDGYAASFSVGELMPDCGGAEVYLAFDRDGQALPEQAQPASLVVPGDRKPSRWVRGVKSITIVDGLAARSD
jgi:DMSO/TMAO reductase YedYZ molybdopterin-dependent catalytic subunit